MFVPRAQNDGIGALFHVAGVVVGPVQATPRVAFMGLVERRQSVSRTVSVQAAGGLGEARANGPVTITGFGKGPPGIRLTRRWHFSFST